MAGFSNHRPPPSLASHIASHHDIPAATPKSPVADSDDQPGVSDNCNGQDITRTGDIQWPDFGADLLPIDEVVLRIFGPITRPAEVDRYIRGIRDGKR